jgi:hypothetical protein
MRENNDTTVDEGLGLTMIVRAANGNEVGSNKDAAAKAINDMVRVPNCWIRLDGFSKRACE